MKNISEIKDGGSISIGEFRALGLHENAFDKKKKSKRPSSLDEILGIADSNSSPKKRNSKFNAKKTVIGDICFDSKFEAERYSTLRIMEKSGIISDLRLQVAYSLDVNGVKICTYIADFVYIENAKTVVEDAKGVKTPEYRLKKKLMLAIHNIDIRETFKNKSVG